VTSGPLVTLIIITRQPVQMTVNFFSAMLKSLIDVAVNFFQQCQLEITAIATAATRHSNGVTRQQRGVSTAAKQNDQTHIHFIFTPTIP
jgi:hypothetical protein